VDKTLHECYQVHSLGSRIDCPASKQRCRVFHKPIRPMSMVWTRNRAMVSGDALVMVDPEASRNIGWLRRCSSATGVAGSSSASDKRLEALEERDEK
jgi:hypothetical protein